MDPPGIFALGEDLSERMGEAASLREVGCGFLRIFALQRWLSFGFSYFTFPGLVIPDALGARMGRYGWRVVSLRRETASSFSWAQAFMLSAGTGCTFVPGCSRTMPARTSGREEGGATFEASFVACRDRLPGRRKCRDGWLRDLARSYPGGF